jgi:hypothetical protein
MTVRKDITSQRRFNLHTYSLSWIYFTLKHIFAEKKKELSLLAIPFDHPSDVNLVKNKLK